MLEYLNNRFHYIKNRYLENNIDNVMWIVDRVPKFVGFSLEKEKVCAFTPFWIVHFVLLFYLYVLGNADYQIYHAQEVGEYIKSYTNISLIALIMNNSLWWINQRPLLKRMLRKLKWSDEMAMSNVRLRENHIKWIKIMKFLAIFFVGLNVTQATFIYLPARVSTSNDFCMTPCLGMDLSYFPQKQICLVILLIVELGIMVVCLNFQALLIVVIAHATAMYDMLAKEIFQLDTDNVESTQVDEKLPLLIQRHAMILDITKDIKSLYSIPIGTNFGSNAICICFFFYLSLEELLGFIPILVYCFLVFFLYCFLCQTLVNAAELFERAVYSCGWEKFGVKHRKTVYVMLLQAQQKVEILAADIVPVNIYTFATTCQFMFKLVTVVKF